MDYHDGIKDVDFDSMHGVDLNVCLHLLKYWWFVKYKGHSFSLYSKLTEANTLLLQYKIPHANNRKPHNLDQFKRWKVSEIRFVIIYHL